MLGRSIQPKSVHSRKSLLNRFTKRLSAESETDQSSEDQNSVQNDALKGVKFATNTLSAMKEKREELKVQEISKESSAVKLGFHTLRTATIDVKKSPMVNEGQNEKIETPGKNLCQDSDDAKHLVDITLDKRLLEIRHAWKDERSSDIKEMENNFGKQFEETHSDLLKKQNEFEMKMLEKHEKSLEAFNEFKSNKSSKLDISILDEKFTQFKKELTEQIESDLKLDVKRMKEEQKHESETYLKKIREEVIQAQNQMADNIKEDVRKEINQLKQELEEQRCNVEKEQIKVKKDEERFSHLQEKCQKEKRQELVEDKFEMKMQLEMKQMKDRLKNDFTKEVEALEEEINDLRRTFDNRSVNYDEGRGSRYGVSDESSDDDVERMIIKQQKKLKKRK